MKPSVSYSMSNCLSISQASEVGVHTLKKEARSVGLGKENIRTFIFIVVSLKKYLESF